MELRRYATLLWHWAWLVVLGTLLAGGAAFAVSNLMTPVYRDRKSTRLNSSH
jgi:uncharacterized protein involved in exopolysaccharide biosynthesis